MKQWREVPDFTAWDPDGTVPPQIRALLDMSGPSFLGTIHPDWFDELTDSAREYIRSGLKLIVEWAELDDPANAVVCVLSQVVTLYQLFYGKPSPWEPTPVDSEGHSPP